MRAEGYYWVKDDGEWEIAKWFEWNPGKYEWDYFDRTRKDEDFQEIDERRIERTEQYGPSPIIVLKRAFEAGMSAVTYNGRPGYPDAPKFDEWYQKWKDKS